MRLTERRKGEIVEENNRLKKELDKNTSMLEENVHKFNMEQSNSQMGLLKEKNRAQHHEEESKNKLSQLQSEIKAGNELIQDLREKNSAQERDYLDKLRLSKEEEWSKLSQSEAEKSNIDKQYIALKQKTSDLEIRDEAILKEQEKECVRIKKELQTTLAIVDSLQDCNRGLVLDREHSSLALEQARTRVDELTSTLSENVCITEGLKTKIVHVSEKNTVAEAAVKTLEAQVDHLNEQGSREVEAYEHTLERQIVRLINDFSLKTHKRSRRWDSRPSF